MKHNSAAIELLQMFLDSDESDALTKLEVIKEYCEGISGIELESDFVRGCKYITKQILEYINE